GAIVEALEVRLPSAVADFDVRKISTRRDADMTAVLGASAVTPGDDGAVQSIRAAYGGMAATPERAAAVEAALTGKPWTAETVEATLPFFEQDFAPISDARASAEYRMLTAKNLLRRLHLQTTGGTRNLTISRYEAA